MSESVFDRVVADGREISSAQYNFIIGLTLCWGFLVNWFMVVNIDPHTILSVNPWLFFGGYIVSCMAGVYLFRRSAIPLVSFIGYNLVVVPFGLVVNVVVSRYDTQLVQDAIRITGMVTLGMMCLASIFPAFFQRIAGALFIALLLTVVVEVVEIFVFNMHHGIIDWIVAAIFCGYIGVDWGRANRIPKTVDNAIDSAAALYMDIINLFLRILRILGSRR